MLGCHHERPREVSENEQSHTAWSLGSRCRTTRINTVFFAAPGFANFMTTVCRRGAAFVLDTAPTVWTSVDEFHYQMSHALFQRGIQPVLLYAVEPPEDYRRRMHASGASIDILNYKTPKTSYFPALGARGKGRFSLNGDRRRTCRNESMW